MLPQNLRDGRTWPGTAVVRAGGKAGSAAAGPRCYSGAAVAGADVVMAGGKPAAQQTALRGHQ